MRDIANATPPRSSGNGKPAPANPGLPKGTLGSSLRNLTDEPLAVTEAAKDKLCRNLYIYGYCKYEGKGCAFRHDRVCLICCNCA